MAGEELELEEGAEGAGLDEAAEDAIWETLGEPEEESEGEPAASAPAAKEAAPGEPWAEFIREGETKEQALARVGREAKAQADRATRHYHEQRRQQEELREATERIKAAEATYQRWREHFEAQAAEGLKAELPDPELEPEKAILNEVKYLRERLEAIEGGRRAEAQTAAQRAQQEAQERALYEADQAAFQEAAQALGVVEGVEADPEFQQAFQAIETTYWNQLSYDYPDATPEQKMQAIELLRTLDARKARARGESYTGYLKSRYRAIYGGAQPAAAPATNGKPAGRPSVQDLERAAARAGKAAGMRRSPAGGGVKLPASLEEFARMGEVEQARAIAAAEKRGQDLEADLWDSLGEDPWS